MAAMAENRMNLAALQQRDPYITGIVDTGSQVALYSFSPETNEWEKTEVEGTLFVYTRSATPINGFMILNRLGLNDMIEPINKHLEFQLQDPFLLYRNGQSSICGVWFYDKDECARIGQLMNSLVQISNDIYEDPENGKSRRERRASEGELEKEAKAKAAAKNADLMGIGLETGASLARNVDIMQMLSRAQDEYDQSKHPVVKQDLAVGVKFNLPKTQNKEVKQQPVGKRSTPKPMIDNPNASATKSTNIIKPLALKPQASAAETEEELIQPVTPSTQISLDTLFKQVGASDNQTQSGHHPQPSSAASQPPGAVGSTSGAIPSGGQMPPLLQRIMSHPGSYLEEIERNQRSEILRDDMPKPAGAEAPSQYLNNGAAAAVPKMPSPPKTVQAMWTDIEPDSPNTALRRSLNIFPGSSPPRSDNSTKEKSVLPTAGGANSNPVFPGLRRAGVGGSSQESHDGGNARNVFMVSQTKVTTTTNVPIVTDGFQGTRVVNSQSRPIPPIQPPTQPSRLHNLSKQVFPLQLPDTSVPPPKLPPVCSSPMVTGINPLQDSLHSQLQNLNIADHQKSKLQEETAINSGVVGGASIAVSSQDVLSLTKCGGDAGGDVGLAGSQDWPQMAAPGSPGTKKMAGLITPQSLISGGGGVTATGGMTNKNLGSVSSQVSSSPLQTSGGSVLLTPMAFESARVTPPGSGPQQQQPVLCQVESDSTSQKSVSPVMLDPVQTFQPTDAVTVNPLTREQLQQAMIHLLQTDSFFLSSLHEAYVKSLQLSMRKDRP